MILKSQGHPRAQNKGEKNYNVSCVIDELEKKVVEQMDEDLLKQIEVETRNQSRCSLWSEMRYARITASKAYEAAHCATLDETLVENILGAKRKP
ncbi:unnamed protein product [Acanthoscelides obtectus]|uniref:Uncharacterized protein n=1 Tax=Acanthoscelides obtectus TaxID=200917 RepID=A0A9P0K313_ACAOB|nr:unnamed protein product [Acanthoscelides obtectus]CAK1639493.1 hypothetical protein AOBTE_LOCUS11215 [Acanthoscelides obtectus]